MEKIKKWKWRQSSQCGFFWKNDEDCEKHENKENGDNAQIMKMKKIQKKRGKCRICKIKMKEFWLKCIWRQRKNQKNQKFEKIETTCQWGKWE